MTHNAYPEDEFDLRARERKAMGAHRAEPMKYRWLLVLGVVIILAPLFGYLIGNAYSRNEAPAADSTVINPFETTTESAAEPTDGEASATNDTAANDAATDDATAEETEAAVPTEEATAEETTAIRYATQVLVLNGRGTAGFASQNAAILNEAGYTNTPVADYRGSAEPAASTIYYRTEDLAATAEDVASLLGATAVLAPEAANSAPIIAVMR